MRVASGKVALLRQSFGGVEAEAHGGKGSVGVKKAVRWDASVTWSYEEEPKLEPKEREL